MNIHVLTIFPEAFDSMLNSSILKKSIENNKLNITFHKLNDFSTKKTKRVDGRIYGGGAGCIIEIEPIYNAIKSIIGSSEFQTKIIHPNSKYKSKSFPLKNEVSSIKFGNKKNSEDNLNNNLNWKIITFRPQGKLFNQSMAEDYAAESTKYNYLLVCGHYEAIDERFYDIFKPDEISIGEYILSGGEIPALVFIDSVNRLIPGVLGNKDSLLDESFSENLDGKLEYPQYGRPENFKGKIVPAELLSGNPKTIENFNKSKLI